MKELFKRLCEKIAKVDDYKDEIKSLKNEISQRDLAFKRIKMISTSNHYGYTKEDKEYREKNMINMKLKKIFELACEFDPEGIEDMWCKIEELEDIR